MEKQTHWIPRLGNLSFMYCFVGVSTLSNVNLSINFGDTSSSHLLLKDYEKKKTHWIQSRL